MKKITFFYRATCPYCANARKAIRELTEENPAYQQLDLTWVEETEQPEVADRYDYYYVPTMFVGGEKLYESNPGESYDECRANVKRVFDAALS